MTDDRLMAALKIGAKLEIKSTYRRGGKTRSTARLTFNRDDYTEDEWRILVNGFAKQKLI